MAEILGTDLRTLSFTTVEYDHAVGSNWLMWIK